MPMCACMHTCFGVSGGEVAILLCMDGLREAKLKSCKYIVNILIECCSA